MRSPSPRTRWSSRAMPSWTARHRSTCSTSRPRRPPPPARWPPPPVRPAPPASVLELRRALLQERGDRLRRRRAERRHDLLAVLVLDGGLLGGDLARGPHAPLREPHPPRCERGDLPRRPACPLAQRPAVDDVRH